MARTVRKTSKPPERWATRRSDGGMDCTGRRQAGDSGVERMDPLGRLPPACCDSSNFRRALVHGYSEGYAGRRTIDVFGPMPSTRMAQKAQRHPEVASCSTAAAGITGFGTCQRCGSGIRSAYGAGE